jgi:hypothetical protein
MHIIQCVKNSWDWSIDILVFSKDNMGWHGVIFFPLDLIVWQPYEKIRDSFPFMSCSHGLLTHYKPP